MNASDPSFKNNILITGAAGFIGSCMVQYLNEKGYKNLILADHFDVEKKRGNWDNKIYKELIDRDVLFDWLQENNPKIDLVIHLGARTDTTEFDYSIHEKLNVEYSETIWNYCTRNSIPLIYASSAATYGSGEQGYNDNNETLDTLKPLNPYGISKNEFDKWALQQQNHPPFWAGLKFFNVYGPNESHKGRMASVIFHSFLQIKKDGFVKLFRSHKEGFKDGEQLRDFIYVKDVVKVIDWMMEQWKKGNTSTNTKDLSPGILHSGIYNLGTGQARSFNDLVSSTFAALDLPANIEFVDMPEDIRDKYQYFTEANMQKLQNAGYKAPFYSLEKGVDDYVRHYLAVGKIY